MNSYYASSSFRVDQFVTDRTCSIIFPSKSEIHSFRLLIVELAAFYYELSWCVKMLSQKERYGVLLYLHYCCKLVPLPAKVNLQDWRLELNLSLRRKGVSLLSLAMAMLNLAFKVASLIYVTAFEKETPLYHFILQVVVTLGAVIIIAFWYRIVYIENLQVHAKLLSMILKRSDDPKSKLPLCHIFSQPTSF